MQQRSNEWLSAYWWLRGEESECFGRLSSTAKSEVRMIEGADNWERYSLKMPASEERWYVTNWQWATPSQLGAVMVKIHAQ